MAEKIKLTIAEQIDRAREGRSQTYIVGKMNDAGVEITEVTFSRKKLGRAEDSFTKDELKALSEILGTTIEG
tara:strand:- start:66 stop:281 length:216 start_codon:yes stop_codon:yes gene_type:complete